MMKKLLGRGMEVVKGDLGSLLQIRYEKPRF
jgi:hypothetical protein